MGALQHSTSYTIQLLVVLENKSTESSKWQNTVENVTEHLLDKNGEQRKV